MLYGDALLGLATVGLWLYALFDVISTDSSLCRNLDKSWWLIIVLFFPLVGSIIWLVAGRPERAPLSVPRPAANGRREQREFRVAPEDDHAFIADLHEQNRQDRELLKRWEEDLKRREEAVRNPPEPPPPAD